MNGLVVVGFRDDHASGAFFQHDYAVAVVIDPQDITDFYIFKGKLSVCDCPCRQVVKGCIAEDKSKSSTAYAPACPQNPSALPGIGITKRAFAAVGGEIRPLGSFFILLVVLQGGHGLIGFLIGGDNSCSGKLADRFRITAYGTCIVNPIAVFSVPVLFTVVSYQTVFVITFMPMIRFIIAPFRGPVVVRKIRNQIYGWLTVGIFRVHRCFFIGSFR